MDLQLGIDVGGTFTDCFLYGRDGAIDTLKTLSTPEDPSIGVLEGMLELASRRGETLEEFVGRVRRIVHGTTVTTNATLTRKGAKAGLLTTTGVRDALEMRRGIREEQYNNRYLNVTPLIPRHLRRTVDGRLNHAGEEITALDLGRVREECEALAEAGVEAVAICFMNAFANPAHENAAAEIVREAIPEAYLSVSSRVLPAVRFYDRVSTTAINAYVGPVLGAYLDSLTGKLTASGFAGVLLIMQSNGGVALPDLTRENAANTLLSGPAAGPRAATAFASAHNFHDCILMDMGGTSFDVCLVRDGATALNTQGEIDRLRMGLPMLDITTIGAGGGSVGWIDEGGLLRMGPESAGAAPGPACYARGGERPACTDANLVLGYLDPEYFAGGAMTLDLEAARCSIENHVARPLDLPVEEAAGGMFRVINSNMAHGAREITVKRGLDPREFPLVVAGGAGPLHACMIARELGIRTLLVPREASILCACGMLLSDLQHDYVQSCISPFRNLDAGQLASVARQLEKKGSDQLRQEGIADSRIEIQIHLDMRYAKQYHEVTVEVGAESLWSGDLSTAAGAFHREHNRLYGYDLEKEGTDLELINLRVRCIGRSEKPPLPTIETGGPGADHAFKRLRRAYVPEWGYFDEIPVYDGHRLLAGNRIDGPALVERIDTTVLISGDFSAIVDRHGSMLLTCNQEEN